MRHPTVRPAFVFGLALAVLLLIPLWVGIGVFASPPNGAGHGGGGHHGGGMSAQARQAFMQSVQAFTATGTREDGCVVPSAAGGEHEAETEKGHSSTARHEPRGGAHAADQGHADRDASEADAVPVVYLQAFQFGFLPRKVCLEAGETYELRMMATDVTHGASIQLGAGSKMVRLPPGVPVSERVTFTQPGEYLLYCSYYCGFGHQYMDGRIVVEPARHAASGGGAVDHERSSHDGHG